MRKPGDLLYGLDDRPPAGVVLSIAVQQATIVLVWLLPAFVLAREMAATPSQAAALFSMTFAACGIGTILQATRRWGLGSGFLAPVTPSSAHLVPSILAAQAGGLPLVAGMTLFAGLLTVLLARALHRIRTLMPPEVAGAVVFIIAIGVSLTGARLLLAGGIGAPPAPAALLVALTTLAVAIGLGIWGQGPLRLGGVLIAMGCGSLLAASLGLLQPPDLAELGSLPLLGLPDLSGRSLAFDLALVPAFVIASVASALKTVGMITALQKLNDADWVRPEPRSIAGGVTGDGLATAVAGLLGAPGVNVSPSNVAIQMASGVTSRSVAFATGALCLLMACFPRAAALLHHIPAPVIAAMLIYAGGLMLANGMQLAATRLLDARRSLSVGLGVAAALTAEAVPQLAFWVPAGLRPLVASTALGTLVALLLNAAFRMGVRRRVTLTIPAEGLPGAEVDAFITGAGASWGARREVVSRAAHLAASCLDAIAVSGCARGALTLELGFDETRIDMRIAWPGAPIILADRPPSADELLDEPEAPARLAGYMVRRLSDRLRLRHRDGTSELTLALDH
ncbi:uracil-xanthine permease family protein [Falsiroseomonas sp.]|uniref:uracil-xanthine permease family protein n=1 Tax=Falsiroseomonas sp. TaxID=2870721 RepID=UPI00356A9F75